MSVNVENMRKWVAALRSGEFKQGRLHLTHAGRHCCLGVACRISPFNMRGSWGDGTLPVRVIEWLGLDLLDDNPFLSHPDMGQVNAVDANDHDGWTFDDIADAIEHTWPEVKVDA